MNQSNKQQTPTAEQKQLGPTSKETAARYIPFAETKEITLTEWMVVNWFSKPTAGGFYPDRADVIKFIATCQSGLLNPFTNDVFLIGYDTVEGKDKIPVFNVIVAFKVLMKKANASKVLAGWEAGIFVKRQGNVVAVKGAFSIDDEPIMGAWATVKRSDIDMPFYAAVKMTAYNKNQSRWKTDPGGMIRKCALAAALREAFPLECTGLYTAEEMGESGNTAAIEGSASPSRPVGGMEELETVLGLTDQTQNVTIDAASQIAEKEALPVARHSTKEKREEQFAGEPNDPRPMGDRARIARALASCGDAVQDIDAAVAALMNEFRWSDADLAFMRQGAEKRKLGE